MEASMRSESHIAMLFAASSLHQPSHLRTREIWLAKNEKSGLDAPSSGTVATSQWEFL